MKTLSLSVYNRPLYLRQVLDTLENNRPSGYDMLHISVENGTSDEVIALCEGIDFMPKGIVHRKQHGYSGPCRTSENIYTAINEAFISGSTFNVNLEDDVLLSPDALALADWYHDKFVQQQSEYFMLYLFSYDSDPSDVYGVQEVEDACSLGWCMFASNWNNARNTWFDDTLAEYRFGPGANGWDNNLRGLMLKTKRKALCPVFSRTKHIGREGTYAHAALDDSLFSHIPYNTTTCVRDFEIRSTPIKRTRCSLSWV